MKQRIVLGTRGSDLALTQTGLVEDALRERWPDLDLERRIIKTGGDEGLGLVATSIAAAPSVDPQAGRKGLFTAEIEQALLAHRIDVAVHSAKDLPSALANNTAIAAVLPRGATADVLVSAEGYDLRSLPGNGCVATGSVRRRHQLQWKRADLKIVDLRGNVPTRLRKLLGESWDAIVLARAGLERLGLVRDASAVLFEGGQLKISVLPQDVFVPAGGQGIIAMQVRADDERNQSVIQSISDQQTRLCLRAEREFLRLLQGDCNQPVGVFAIVEGNDMKIRAQVFRSGASFPQQALVRGASADAEKLASQLFRMINGNQIKS